MYTLPLIRPYLLLPLLHPYIYFTPTTGDQLSLRYDAVANAPILLCIQTVRYIWLCSQFDGSIDCYTNCISIQIFLMGDWVLLYHGHTGIVYIVYRVCDV